LGFKALFTYTKTLYLAQHKNPSTINLAKQTQNINFLAKQIHHTTQEGGFKMKKLDFDHTTPIYPKHEKPRTTLTLELVSTLLT
jgi:hypothetical protein